MIIQSFVIIDGLLAFTWSEFVGVQWPGMTYTDLHIQEERLEKFRGTTVFRHFIFIGVLKSFWAE